MKFRNTKIAMVTLSSFFILGSASLSFTDTIHGEVASASPQEITVKSYDDTYYNNAIGKTGLELKKELHNIIDNHTKLSYKVIIQCGLGSA